MRETNRPFHMGWRKEEEEILFTQVKQARGDGRPLKGVFESVAVSTGRKPNSVRNYYYARIKEDESLSALPGGMAFVPFTEAEIRDLLGTVLSAQAKGVSVRACTLAMGKGDNKAMLRYQNKYRSLVKSNPELVRAVRAELLAQGIPACDPYDETSMSVRVGRPRKGSGDRATLLEKLSAVEGFDAFLLGFGRYTDAVARKERVLMEAEASLDERLRENSVQMGARLKSSERELESMRERFNTLLSLYRQLVSVNRDFLGMSGALSAPSSLNAYIRDLSRNVEDCERLLPEIM